MKPKYLFALLLIIGAAVSLLSSCKDSITATQIDTTIIPSSNVSFAKYIQPVINLKCVSCHGINETDGGVNLTTWAGVTDPSIVTKGFPDNSPLVWSVEGKAGFTMPPAGSSYLPFNTNQVNGLKTWIKEGAKNN